METTPNWSWLGRLGGSRCRVLETKKESHQQWPAVDIFRPFDGSNPRSIEALRQCDALERRLHQAWAKAGCWSCWCRRWMVCPTCFSWHQKLFWLDIFLHVALPLYGLEAGTRTQPFGKYLEGESLVVHVAWCRPSRGSFVSQISGYFSVPVALF